MRKAETRFQDKVLEDLRKLPKLWARKISQMSIRGTPDILFCCLGKFGALELKADENSTTADLQLYNAFKIQEAGGYAKVVWPAIWPQVLDEIKTRFFKERKF